MKDNFSKKKKKVEVTSSDDPKPFLKILRDLHT